MIVKAGNLTSNTYILAEKIAKIILKSNNYSQPTVINFNSEDLKKAQDI